MMMTNTAHAVEQTDEQPHHHPGVHDPQLHAHAAELHAHHYIGDVGHVHESVEMEIEGVQHGHHVEDGTSHGVVPTLPVAQTLEELRHSDGGYLGDHHAAHIVGMKRTIDDVFPHHGGYDDVSEPERKRRRATAHTDEAQLKRQRYDVLKAFFRVYFREDKSAMVLKESIYNLYVKKIPAPSRIARNATYRHMWSVFKDKISAFQQNYREYVKGLALVMDQTHLAYDGAEQDIKLLQDVGVTDFYGFTEEELSRNSPEKEKITFAPAADPYMADPAQPTLPSAGVLSEEAVIQYIEGLEETTKTLLQSLKELKMKIRKASAAVKKE